MTGTNGPRDDAVERELEGVPEELRIRLLWLQAKLSFDNNQPEASLRQTDALLESLGRDAQLASNENAVRTTRMRATGKRHGRDRRISIYVLRRLCAVELLDEQFWLDFAWARRLCTTL